MKRNDDYIIRTIAGETLLVPTGKAAQEFSGLVTLNELGTFIWEHMNEAADTEALCQMILEEYDGDPQEVRKDTEEFLELLSSHHMAAL